MFLRKGRNGCLRPVKRMLKIPNPKLAKQVRGFLGMVRFCCLRIPEFAEIAKPLCEATTGGQDLAGWRKDKGHLKL